MMLKTGKTVWRVKCALLLAGSLAGCAQLMQLPSDLGIEQAAAARTPRAATLGPPDDEEESEAKPSGERVADEQDEGTPLFQTPIDAPLGFAGRSRIVPRALQ